MAKVAKKTSLEDDDNGRNEGERKVVHSTIVDYDEQREEDERKDRERLKNHNRLITPERKSEIMTELANLKVEYEGKIAEIRKEYADKKNELETEGAAGVEQVNPGAIPTNETLEDGTPRSKLRL